MRTGPAARLFALALALAVGVTAADRAAPPVPMVLGLAAAGGLLALARRRAGALLLAACTLGLALGGLKVASTEDAALARGARGGADALLEGEALSDPQRVRDAARFMLGVRLAEIDGDPVRVRERVWLTVRPAPDQEIRAGSILRVDARLRPVLLPDMDAAGRAAATRLRRRGIAARAFAVPDGVSVLGRTANPIAVVADAGRQAVRRAARTIPEAERGLLLGVTIGDVSLLDPVADLDFRATGLTHLLAVSGANVAMVLAVVALLLRLARAGPRLTLTALGVTTLSFMAITRFEPSVLRAGAMSGVALMGLAVGARRRATNALAVATLGLLAYEPFMVFEAGFQLSVLATVGILAIAPRIAQILPPGKLAAAAAVTLGAQLAVAPLIALNFRQVSLISIGANLLVGPAVGPATVIGMTAAAAGGLWEPLAGVARAAVPALAWMRWVAHVLAELPLASVATPGGALGLLVAAAMTAAALAAARGTRPRRLAPLLLSLALIVTGGVWARAVGPPPLHGLVVTMIDVGQGEAVLVRAGEQTMLVDGGPDQGTLLRALRAERVRRIDLLVISHPHADHIAGLVPVARTMPVGRALDPFIATELTGYHGIVASLAARRVPRDRATAGMRYGLGGATVEVLWPPAERMEGTAEDTNNNSIVLRVRYGAGEVLLAGETQEEAQDLLLEHPEALRAEVLKVSHHGSRHMVPAFYAATGASVALIPVGPNTFGHPAQDTLAALAGMRVLRSDDHGTVHVGVAASGAVDVRTQRGPAPDVSSGSHEAAGPDPVRQRVPGVPGGGPAARALVQEGLRGRGGGRRGPADGAVRAGHAVAVRRRPLRDRARHRPAARSCGRPVRRLGRAAARGHRRRDRRGPLAEAEEGAGCASRAARAGGPQAVGDPRVAGATR